jgi:magnesium-protoporphyrin IX monomethyl ester (oxidative) cyclase
MYVAAAIRDICEVQIYDCMTVKGKRVDGNEVTYGASPEQIRDKIAMFKPDIVGISDCFTMQYHNVEKVAEIVKEVDPQIVVVLGGADASVRYEAILKNNNFEACVVGEGEETFREFVQKWPKPFGIRGVVYPDSCGKVHYEPRPFVKDLDYLPFPAYDLVDVPTYLKDNTVPDSHDSICRNAFPILTSRGCPFSCVFCALKLHMGQNYRVHSPAQVLRQIMFLRVKYGVETFHFIDDNLTLDKNRFSILVDGLADLHVKWDTGGLRVDTLDFPLLQQMKRAGCRGISIAIESGVQRVLDKVIKKGTSLAHAVEVAKMAKTLGLETAAFYVVGCPGETLEEIRETLRLAVELYRNCDLTPQVTVATPFYGTELYETSVAHGYIKNDPASLEMFNMATAPRGSPMITTPEFSPDILRTAIGEYGKERRRIRKRFMLRHPKEAAKWLKRVLIRRKWMMLK